MDWTLNDSLYHRFLKWKMKYENILDCELAMLSEAPKSRKLWPGQVILKLTSMYPGACPQKIYAWRYFGLNLSSANLKPMRSEQDFIS